MSLAPDAPPSEFADAIRAERDRLVAWVKGCPPEQWELPLSADDPRPVGVVVDHVADAYRYLGLFVRALVAGEPLEVSSDIVDRLNEEHGKRAAGVTADQATAHLNEACDGFAELVAGLDPAAFGAEHSRLRRFAEIGVLHPRDHLAELEAATAI